MFDLMCFMYSLCNLFYRCRCFLTYLIARPKVLPLAFLPYPFSLGNRFSDTLGTCHEAWRVVRSSYLRFKSTANNMNVLLNENVISGFQPLFSSACNNVSSAILESQL